MPLQRIGPDNNGLYYNALNTSEWAAGNPIGDGLRARGYRYCGFGTWGVYVAAPGQPCWEKAPGVAQPNILPPAPPTDTPGPVSAVSDKACGTCRKSTATGTTGPIPTPGAPAPTPGARPASKSVLPWWLWVLVALTAAQVVYGRNNA